ncbi:MAG: 4-hydroxy-3-methylbut-2-enyl diphosphate reductase [Alistipes sp.]|jgi:4-hydroxy-3-methylbut-2-enyl diphosphate reductase|nr:4-hydroxy-3-methylbut-2-enyl diphosphate reductase [Alistipes sp.]
MRVEVDDRSGFCFGVVNAISRAEACLEGSNHGSHCKPQSGPREEPGQDCEKHETHEVTKPLVSLGDIVHNGAEMARLEALGLEVASENTDMATLAGRTVLIRAHGEPPETYSRARLHGVTLIDATCPVVARLQKTVADAHAEMSRRGGQVVIFGQRGHAEVRGLTGQITGLQNKLREGAGGAPDGSRRPEVLVVEDEADLDAIDFARPVYFLAQTTGSLTEFRRLGDIILNKSTRPEQVTIHDTICRQVAGREEHLAGFARRFDVVVFVSGAKSSNGRVLFEAVRAANPNSHKIENIGELRPEWFSKEAAVGVCGATSTPRWLMNEVAEAIQKTATK